LDYTNIAEIWEKTAEIWEKTRKYGNLRLFICGTLATYRFFSICGNVGKCGKMLRNCGVFLYFPIDIFCRSVRSSTSKTGFGCACGNAKRGAEPILKPTYDLSHFRRVSRRRNNNNRVRFRWSMDVGGKIYWFSFSKIIDGAHSFLRAVHFKK
jgi:hypothetical protein